MRAPRRVLLPFVLVGALGFSNAQEPPKGLNSVLQDVRVPITAQTLDVVAKAADEKYEAMYTPLGSPSVELLSSWVDLSEYYRAEWQKTPERVRDVAVRLSNRAFNGSLVSWVGFASARKEGKRVDKAVGKLCDEAPCPEGSTDAARSHLLYHLSVHRAHMVQHALGDSPSLAENVQFGSAYNRLVPLAKEFKLLKERDAYVHAGLMEGRNQLQNIVKRGEYDPVAAVTNMQQARWLLERAKNGVLAETARPYVAEATDRLRLGRQFGASRASIRDALSPTLTSQPLEQMLLTSIVTDREERGGTGSTHVTIPFPNGPAPSEAKVEGPMEKVTVTAEKGNINPDTYVLDELQALAAQLPPRESIDKHEGVQQLGPLLFHGLLQEIVGESKYTQLRAVYFQGLTRKERDAAEQKYPFLGCVVATNPLVYGELFKSGDIIPVANRLGYVDAPEIYVDIAGMWSSLARNAREEAQRLSENQERPAALSTLVTAVDDSRRANLNYVHASWRYLSDRVPSSLHLNIGASAQALIASHAQAVALMREAGIAGPDAKQKLRAYVGPDGERAERVLVQAAQQQTGLVRMVDEAYRVVIDRGPSPKQAGSQKAADEHFAFYENAIARLSSSKTSAGDVVSAKKLEETLMKAKSADALQFYARGDAREVILRDAAAAQQDFARALELLPTGDVEVQEYRTLIQRRLGSLK